MNYDFFIRTETQHRPWEEHVTRPANCYRLDLPESSDVEALLEAAYKAGMPKGSARSGCFEIQCDTGIWTRSDSRGWGRLTSSNAVFSAWEALD